MDTLKIGDKILEYRKKNQLTQDQLADKLGITSGAVSKWETGSSLPDISLLSPLARALDITVDELLSFHMNLTEEEVNKIKAEIMLLFMTKGYVAGDQACTNYLRKYPNSQMLKFNIATLYGIHSVSAAPVGEEESQERMKKAILLFQEVAESGDLRWMDYSWYTLATLYMMLDELDKAEEMIENIKTPADLDAKSLYLSIYQRQGKTEKVKKMAQNQLLQSLNSISAILAILIDTYSKEGKVEKSLLYSKILTELEEHYHVGLGVSNFRNCKDYLKQGKKEEAAKWFLGYVNILVSAEYGYSHNPLFDELSNPMQTEVEEHVRQTMIQSLLENENMEALSGLADYEEGLQKLMAAKK